MKIENGTLVLETTECHCARTPTPGRVVPIQSCCRKKKCATCKGSGYIQFAAVECSTCKGSTVRMETLNDSAPQDMLDAIPLRVFRSDRGATWNEQYLGLGCVYSCIDYGDSSKMTDEDLIARVRERSTRIQTVHVVRRVEDKIVEVAEAFGIYVNRSGYSVRPIFASSGVKTFTVPAGQDIAIGHAVYNAGGNGSLAAALAE